MSTAYAGHSHTLSISAWWLEMEERKKDRHLRQWKNEKWVASDFEPTMYTSLHPDSELLCSCVHWLLLLLLQICFYQCKIFMINCTYQNCS